MLEYDLILPSPAKLPSLAGLFSEKGKLRDLLAAWNDSVEKDKMTQKSDFPTLLTYICDSYYTTKDLNFNFLLDNDRLRAACLKELCSQIGMGLYIANLDRTRSGSCNYYPRRGDHHDIEDEDEDSITLPKIVDFAGNTVEGAIAIEVDEHFIQGEPFDDGPDDEDFEYEYGFVTQYYRKTVGLL